MNRVGRRVPRRLDPGASAVPVGANAVKSGDRVPPKREDKGLEPRGRRGDVSDGVALA